MTTADEKMNKEFEQWYVENAFDYPSNPIGSRDCGLQRKAWQASAAQYSARLKELEQQVQFWAEHTPNDEFCRKYAELEQQLSIVGDELTELRKFETGAKTVIGELEQQNEQLQAQVAMLVDTLKDYQEFTQISKTGEIPVVTYSNSAHNAIENTNQIAKVYKRRIQAEALEAAAQFFIEEPNSASRRAAKELDRMAAELKEGE